MASGVVAKPMGDLAGLSGVMRGRPDPRADQRDMREGLTYEPRTPAGRAAAQYNPIALLSRLWGAGAHEAGRMFGEDDPKSSTRSAFGHGVEETVNQLPNLVGAEGAGGISTGLKSAARDTTQSALKPSAKAQRQTLPVTGKTKADSAIDTLLNEGVNVSRGGARKLQDMVDEKNTAIAQLIDNSPAVIDKHATAAYLSDAVKKFEKQVNPLDDLAQVQKAWDEFLTVHPDKIPIKQAQQLKQGTNRKLRDAYGEQKDASVEAQKTLVRGLKEEIAKAAPQVRQLNAQESELLNALSLVEKRSMMEANKNPMGLSLIAMDKAKMAAFMADRSGLFKSLVARMLNTASRASPTTLPPLGAAITSQTGQPQLPPPPQQ
jgi:hypothetical protein